MVENKELEYFMIGDSYGGNQRWMLDPWMHIGGCAALTTCDAFIYLALKKGRTGLCPYDASSISRKQYRKFAMSMKPYLQPRESGIKDLDTYAAGVRAYLEDTENADISMSCISGKEAYDKAEKSIRDRIDKGIPVPYLMLKHRDRKFDFFEWHWFLVIGYRIKEDVCFIKAATYGKFHWLPLKELWETGNDEKGGIVLLDL